MKRILRLFLMGMLSAGACCCDEPLYEPDTEEETAPDQAVPGQCEAITQNGTRCKRSVSAGSTYCWQHAPEQ